MKPRIKELFILFCVFTLSSKAQPIKRAWNWYFGDLGGINFSSGNPIAVGNSKMHAGEACTAISDTLGDLL